MITESSNAFIKINGEPVFVLKNFPDDNLVCVWRFCPDDGGSSHYVQDVFREDELESFEEKIAREAFEMELIQSIHRAPRAKQT